MRRTLTSRTRGVAVDSHHVYWATSGTARLDTADVDGTGDNQCFISGTCLRRAGGSSGESADQWLTINGLATSSTARSQLASSLTP